MTRADGRAAEELRPVAMRPGFMPYAEGSCLIEMGDTKVICTATIESGVPRWMQGRGSGWLTAEYSMLPRSSPERVSREVNKGRPSGRTQEIQRLIGRSLRAVADMQAMGEVTLLLDCDVLQADGGTRTASITGAYVSASLAFQGLVARGDLAASPLVDSVSAILPRENNQQSAERRLALVSAIRKPTLTLVQTIARHHLREANTSRDSATDEHQGPGLLHPGSFCPLSFREGTMPETRSHTPL